MADCIHPRYYKVRDAFTGEYHIRTIRCGKCCNCLAAEQDSWSVRLSESCAAHDDFIYTTLTLAPEFFCDPRHFIDVSDAIYNPEFVFSDETFHLLHYWSEALQKLQVSSFTPVVPCFDKSVLSDWIKRGRERYFRDTGKRLHFKYLFTSEYGPKHSRPHAHGVLIGLPLAVYREYFERPWQQSFGYTNTQYIRRNPKYPSSCVAVAHYISKYINKGYFESPLVKEGLAPKCWRFISNGIGEELLDTPKYKVFQNDNFKRLASQCERYDLSCRTKKIVPYSVDRKRKVAPFFVWSSDPQNFAHRFDLWPCSDICDFIGISLSQLKATVIYLDSGGYPHALPRYYRYKLLGYQPNFFKFAVQMALQAHALERYNTDLERIAAGIERAASRVGEPDDDVDSLRLLSLFMAAIQLDFDKKNEALRREQRYFTAMKNHYKRPKSYMGRDIRLLQ